MIKAFFVMLASPRERERERGIARGQKGGAHRAQRCLLPLSNPLTRPAKATKTELCTIPTIDPLQKKHLKRKGKKEEGRIDYTYHIQSHHRVHLDGSVEIPKQDRHGQQEHINRVADIVTQQFNPLARKHPQIQRGHGAIVRDLAPTHTSLVAQPNEEQVAEQRRGRQRSQVHSIGTPGLATVRLGDGLAAAEKKIYQNGNSETTVVARPVVSTIFKITRPEKNTQM